MKMCLQVKSERSKVSILLLLTIYHIQGFWTGYSASAGGSSRVFALWGTPSIDRHRHLVNKTEALGIIVYDTVERDFRREGTV